MIIIFGLCKTYAEEKSDTILHKNSNTNAEDISTLAYEENLTREMELLTRMLFKLVFIHNIVRYRYYSKHFHNKEYQREVSSQCPQLLNMSSRDSADVSPLQMG